MTNSVSIEEFDKSIARKHRHNTYAYPVQLSEEPSREWVKEFKNYECEQIPFFRRYSISGSKIFIYASQNDIDEHYFKLEKLVKIVNAKFEILDD